MRRGKRGLGEEGEIAGGQLMKRHYLKVCRYFFLGHH